MKIKNATGVFAVCISLLGLQVAISDAQAASGYDEETPPIDRPPAHHGENGNGDEAVCFKRAAMWMMLTWL